MTDKTPAEHVETLRAWLAHPFSIPLSRDELIAALTYAIDRLTAEPAGVVSRAALETVRACVQSLEGAYGFPDDTRVDTRHFGKLPSGEHYNDFVPLTWGDLRALAKLPSVQADLEPLYPISTDGPHMISDNRRTLARWLMDSRMDDDTAYGAVGHSPAISDLYAAAPKPPLEGGWLDIASAPAPSGYIDEYPSFYEVKEATVIRYAGDEQEAVCLIRAKLIDTGDGQRWEPYLWAPLPPPPAQPEGEA